MFFHPKDASVSFQGHTLILPAVSIGNVGQLATDLLISNLGLQLVGHIHDEDVLPVAGADAYGVRGRVVTSVDVYQATDRPLTVVQQRAPVASKRRTAFTDRLVQWLSGSGVSRVVLLTSANAKNRRDHHMMSMGVSLRYAVTGAGQAAEAELGKMGWAPLEHTDASYLSEQERKRAESRQVVGGGITQQLYAACEERGLPLVVLIMFCFEGDNIMDSTYLACKLDDWLQLLPASPAVPAVDQLARWRPPVSWEAMYGSGYDTSIY